LALRMPWPHFLGLRPRLVWAAPLAPARLTAPKLGKT